MKLKYAGLRPFIDEHGISFKKGKEDKYIYLSYAINLLLAIDENYEKEKKHSFNLDNSNIKESEMFNTLVKYDKDLEIIIQNKIDEYKKHLNKEKNEVKNKTTLNEIEKVAFINNLNIMQEYKIQRAKNKIVYFYTIKTICRTITKNKIKHIQTPFNEKFWHILQSIQGKLAHYKITTNLETINKDDDFKITLSMNI